MKIIDRDGRLFGKISVIDVLVLLAVLVLAAALYVKTNQRELTGTTVTNSPITYQMKISGARSYVSEAVQEGDLIYEPENDSNGPLGRIVSVERTPGTSLVQFSDGTVLDDVPMEDSVDLLLTIEGSGIQSNGVYMLNRVYPVAVNSSRTFATKFVQFTATVAAVMP